PPPMNMSATDTRSDCSCSAPTSIELSPLVRSAVDWNSEGSSLSYQASGPNVPGFDHSKARKTIQPPTKRIVVPARVILVWRLHRRRPQPRRVNSNRTGMPRLPMIAAAMEGPLISQSVWNLMKESWKRLIPALLKELTAWNRPCHSDATPLNPYPK